MFMDIYVRDIIERCNGKLICGDKDLVIDNLCNDSRKVKEGDVYLGIRGEVFDGNTFYKDALDKGAKCCILDNIDDIDNKYKDKTIVFVDDTVKCIQELARYKRSLYDIPVIGVTGSVGKTSTKDMIYSVVSKKYKTLRTIGNYNNHIGLPLTILNLKDEELLLVEMGMNHLGELSVLSKIGMPTIGVITNVGTAHIGNLGSRENILKAKLEILDGMDNDGLLFINNDNDLLHKEYDRLSSKYNVVSIGIDNDSDDMATDILEDVFSSKFNVKDICENVNVQVGGRVFIYNSLIAFAIGDKLGIDKELIKEGINDFKLSSHRLEKKINNKGTVIIDDTYNANYDSMKSAIELLGRVKDKRHIAILGDMLELGDYAIQIHKDIGDVVSGNVDILITIGDYSKYIADRALEMGFIHDNIYGFDKEDECYMLLEALLTDKDIVLVKGSHSINLVNVVDKIMEFK